MILTIENFVNAGVKTVRVKDAKHFWVRMRDVEKGLGLKALRNLVNSLQELTNNTNDNMKDKYIRNDIAEKIIKNCRGVKKTRDNLNKSDKEKQRQNFRLLLGFNEHDMFNKRTINNK